MTEPVSWPDAIEIERVLPASGNMTVGPQQFWLGTSRAGQTVRFWIDTTTVHLSIGGWRSRPCPPGFQPSTLPGSATLTPAPQDRHQLGQRPGPGGQ